MVMGLVDRVDGFRYILRFFNFTAHMGCLYFSIRTCGNKTIQSLKEIPSECYSSNGIALYALVTRLNIVLVHDPQRLQ